MEDMTRILAGFGGPGHWATPTDGSMNPTVAKELKEYLFNRHVNLWYESGSEKNPNYEKWGASGNERFSVTFGSPLLEGKYTTITRDIKTKKYSIKGLPQTGGAVYNRCWRWLKSSRTCILVEGIFDVHAVYNSMVVADAFPGEFSLERGVFGSMATNIKPVTAPIPVALLGCGLHPAQADVLNQYVDRYIILLDGDLLHKSCQIALQLHALGKPSIVLSHLFSPEEDPGNCPPEKLWSIIQNGII